MRIANPLARPALECLAMAPGTNPPLSECSDEQLVERYRNGTAEAYTVLVGRYRQELFHYLVKFVNSRAQADDLFQETFLQVHVSIDTFDVSRRFRPWLFTIASNKARDWLRKKKRRRSVNLSALAPDPDKDEGRGLIDLMESDLPMPDVVAEDAETRRRIKDVVDQMPDHLREVLLLAYFQRFAYKEIAEMLSIPLGTVKSRLHAAVGYFADLWKQQATDERTDRNADDVSAPDKT